MNQFVHITFLSKNEENLTGGDNLNVFSKELKSILFPEEDVEHFKYWNMVKYIIYQIPDFINQCGILSLMSKKLEITSQEIIEVRWQLLLYENKKEVSKILKPSTPYIIMITKNIFGFWEQINILGEKERVDIGTVAMITADDIILPHN